MPDANKRDSSLRTPRQREPVCPQKSEASALMRLLDEWMLGDETEQRETFECLRRCLDEDRPKGYKLFS